LPVGVSGARSISGVVGNEVVATTGRGLFDSVNASATSADRGIVRGNLELDGADSANYRIDGFTNGSGTIGKAALTVKANDATGVVGLAEFEVASQQPRSGYEGYEGVSYIGLVPADIISGATPRAGVINVGTVTRVVGYSPTQTTYAQSEYLNSLEPQGYTAANYVIQPQRGNYIVARSADLSVTVRATSVYGAESIAYSIEGGKYCVSGICSQSLSASKFIASGSSFGFSNERPDTVATGTTFSVSENRLSVAGGAIDAQATVGARVTFLDSAGSTLGNSYIGQIFSGEAATLIDPPSLSGSIAGIRFTNIDKATFSFDVGAIAKGSSPAVTSLGEVITLSVSNGEINTQATQGSIVRFYSGEHGSGTLLGTSSILSAPSANSAVLSSNPNISTSIGSVVFEKSKSSTQNYTVGTHSLIAPASSLQNIQRVVVAGNLVVTPKSLTVIAEGARKTYDGLLTSSAQVSATGIVSRTINSGTRTDAVLVEGVTSFSSRNVGTGNVPYTISNITVSGDDSGNYTVQGGGSLSFSNGTIDPMLVTITVGSGPTRV
jgi:hypothetical protein